MRILRIRMIAIIALRRENCIHDRANMMFSRVSSEWRKVAIAPQKHTNERKVKNSAQITSVLFTAERLNDLVFMR